MHGSPFQHCCQFYLISISLGWYNGKTEWCNRLHCWCCSDTYIWMNKTHKDCEDHNTGWLVMITRYYLLFLFPCTPPTPLSLPPLSSPPSLYSRSLNLLSLLPSIPTSLYSAPYLSTLPLSCYPFSLPLSLRCLSLSSRSHILHLQWSYCHSLGRIGHAGYASWPTVQ